MYAIHRCLFDDLLVSKMLRTKLSMLNDKQLRRRPKVRQFKLLHRCPKSFTLELSNHYHLNQLRPLKHLGRSQTVLYHQS